MQITREYLEYLYKNKLVAYPKSAFNERKTLSRDYKRGFKDGVDKIILDLMEYCDKTIQPQTNKKRND